MRGLEVDSALDSIASIAEVHAVDSARSDVSDDTGEIASPVGVGFDALGGERGRFKILAEIGAGGTGRVALVRDQRLLRDVAWKRGGSRLLREARVLAQLEHPGIVPIHDLGFGPRGEPYFAMRVVRGRSLAEVLRGGLDEADRKRLLRACLQAAEAVAYAHRRGVVHRDLKPANIMLGDFGECQVVDWGLACVMDDAEEPIDAAIRLALSGSGKGRVGTPGYMSPEQERGEEADRRSDVFGLGRVLAAVVGDRGEGRDGRVDGGRRSGRRVEDRSSARELAAIIAKSTAAERAVRYPDAHAFAADLARWLDGERVEAHRYRLRELARRFARRHPTLLVAVAAGLVALGVLGLFHVSRLDREHGRALAAEAEARQALARSDLHLARARLAESEAKAALERSDRHLSRALVGEARRMAERGAVAEASVLAANALTLGEDADARGVLAAIGARAAIQRIDRRALPCEVAELDPRDRGRTATRDEAPRADAEGPTILCAEATGLSLWTATPEPTRLWSRAFPVRVARFVEAGIVVASADEIVVFDRRGERVFEAPALTDPTRRVAGAGARVLLEGGGVSQLVDLIDASVTPLAPCGAGRHSSIALDPDPTAKDPVAVTLCMDGTMRGPGVEGGLAQTPLIAPQREGIRVARLARGLLLFGTNKGELVLVDRAGRVVRQGFVVEGFVRVLEPSPDERFVAVAGEGETIQVLTLPELARVASIPRRANGVTWDPTQPRELLTTGRWLERWRLVAPDPDRPLVGAYSVPLEDGVVSLDVDPRRVDRVAVGHGGYGGVLTAEAMVTRPLGFITTKAVSFVESPTGLPSNGDALFAAGARGFVRLAADDLGLVETLPPWSVRRLATLGDGSSIIGLYSEARRRLADGDIVVLEPTMVRDLSAAPGRGFAVMLREADRALLRVRAGVPGSEVVGFDTEAEAVAVSADGERFYGARRGAVTEWDEGGLALEYDAGTHELVDVEVSGDGRWVAAGARDGTVFLWVRGDAVPRARFMDHVERVPAMVFSRDARWLVTGSWDRTLRVRDLAAVTEDPRVLEAGLERDLGLGLGEALGSER